MSNLKPKETDLSDPFYSEANQRELKRRIDNIEADKAAGRLVVKTTEELEAMENE